MFVINTVTISGNATRDPELRSTPSGTSVCQLGVAVNERVKQGDNWSDRASFIDVTAWGSLAEQIAKQVHKGKQVVVTGRIRQDRWQAQDGTNRSKVYVVADAFVTPRGGESNGNGQTTQHPLADRGDIPFDQTPAPASAPSPDNPPFT